MLLKDNKCFIVATQGLYFPYFYIIFGVKFMKNFILFHSKSGLYFALVALLSFGSVFSISADEEEDSAEVAEEIVVTGSRIKRASNISSPTPMVTLGEVQIEQIKRSINTASRVELEEKKIRAFENFLRAL